MIESQAKGRSISIKLLIEGIKSVLRVRHRLKTKLLGLLMIERGQIPRANLIQEVHTKDQPTKTSDRNKNTNFKTPSLHYPKIAIYRFHNAKLFGKRALLITKHKRIISELMYGVEYLTLGKLESARPLFYWLKSFLSTPKTSEHYFLVASPFMFNYYHWVTDCLPQVRYFLLSGIDARLLFPDKLARWQTEYLSALGISDGEFDCLSNTDGIEVDSLFISNWHKPSDISPPRTSDLGWIRKNILSSRRRRRRTLSNFPSFIFINREDSEKGSRIANETEVEKALLSLGFKSVSLAKHSVADQAAIFNTAKVIVSSHGAGLTNLLFSDSSITVELMPNVEQADYFSKFTTQNRGTHYLRIADSVDSNERGIVDIPKLSDFIASLIEENKA